MDLVTGGILARQLHFASDIFSHFLKTLPIVCDPTAACKDILGKEDTVCLRPRELFCRVPYRQGKRTDTLGSAIKQSSRRNRTENKYVTDRTKGHLCQNRHQ